MPSITSWQRLEPRCRDDRSGVALQARLHDPLWLLARQWQVGEFQGEDSGSPVRVRWQAECSPLTRLLPGAVAANTDVRAPAFDVARQPLETAVERRPVDASASLRRVVEAGLRLRRLVDAAPTGRRHGALLVTAFALAPPEAPAQAALDAASLAWWRSMAGRVADARRVAAALRAPDGSPRRLAQTLGVPARDRAEVDAAIDRWAAEEGRLFEQPPPAAEGAPARDAWQSERMEYAFSAAAGHADGTETALTASEYTDGRLDWSAVDVDLEIRLGAAADVSSADATHLDQTTMPAPVSFRGMPAPRFWEFEDARIDWGLIDAGPGDLPHLLLADAVTDFGNDWYVVPADIPVGTLTRTRSLVVTDSFGVRTLLRPSNAEGVVPAAGFSLFQLAALRRPGGAKLSPQSNLLFLAPTLANALEGRPLEDVLLMRDEIANLAWAIERVVEGPMEQPLDLGATSAAPDASNAAVAAAEGLLRYRLATPVPANWVPLLPQRDGAGALRLVRGATLDAEGSALPHGARGQLLNPPGGALALFDEEVPREGARLVRAVQHTRWFDGSSLLWVGLRNTAGRGEGASGLRFDTVE